MAYNPRSTPRRRKQAVPDMRQMVRRRAASPFGQPPAGTLPGPMPVPRRQVPTPNANAYANANPKAAFLRATQSPHPWLQHPWAMQQQNQLGHAAYQPLPYPGPRPTPGQTPPTSPWPTTNPAPPSSVTPTGSSAPGGRPNPAITDPNEILQAFLGQAPHTGGSTTAPPLDLTDPRERARYWANQGWRINQNGTGFIQDPRALERWFNNPYQPGGGGGAPPPGGGGGGGGSTTTPPGGGGNVPPGTPPPPGSSSDGSATGGGPGTPPPPDNNHPPGPPTTTMPLDPYYEAQRRMLDDRLQGMLGSINPQYGVIDANQALQEARLGTNEGVDQRHMLESLAGRGIFGSGVQTRDQGYLSTDYTRQRGDLAQQLLGQRSQLDLQKSQAQMDYQSGMMEALMALAARQAAMQNTPAGGVI